MAHQKKYFGLLAMGVSLVSLGACSVNHPNAMPSGYTHHREIYKSPTPPPSPKITAQQRQYMDSAQAEQFRDAVYDLLTRLTHRAGMPPKPVYIMAPEPMTTFYANIDNDLREGMRHIGYALSDMPVGAYVFAYDAQAFEKPRGTISTGAPNVEIVLKVFDSVSEDARMLSEESGWYYIQGAETLNIKPAQYKMLPTRERLKWQAAGFSPTEDLRTAMQHTAIPRQFPERPETIVTRPLVMRHQDEMPDFQPVQSMVQPVPRAPTNYASDYDGPMQAVTIDSGGVSYGGDVPYVNSEPLSPRARVSNYMDY